MIALLQHEPDDRDWERLLISLAQHALAGSGLTRLLPVLNDSSVLMSTRVQHALLAGDTRALVEMLLVHTSAMDRSGYLILEDGVAWGPKPDQRVASEPGLSGIHRVQDGHLLPTVGSGGPFEWRVETSGLQLPGGLVLDRESPVSDALLRDKRSFAALDQEHVEGFGSKLVEAIEVIAGTAPTLWQCMTRWLNIVVPAETVRRTRVVRHGASHPMWPGAVLMNDYHRPEISLAELAENLVHEFVHNLLFALERLEPWARDDQRLDSETRSSLWSDRELSFYSFFHSLIVFGAVEDWTRVAMKEQWPAASAEFLKRRPSELHAGFKKLAGRFDALGLGPALLSPAGCDLVEKLVAPRTTAQ